MEFNKNIVESIFKQEENVTKFNAVITIPNLRHGDNYFFNDGTFKWICKNFAAYAKNKEYKIPDLLYYLNRRILLLVFWLDQLPTEKDMENSREFVQYFEKSPPAKFIREGRECYISSKFKDSSLVEDMEVRNVFMVPADSQSNNNEVSEAIKKQIIYYRYKEHEVRGRNIHHTWLQTNEINKILELDFINDYHRYFMISKLHKVVIGDKYIMDKASLRDVCINKIAPYDPGVYAIFYENKIKKIGKAEAGIYQRLKDYYNKNSREQTCGEAGHQIDEINKDSIEIAWLVCPKDQCKDKEKEIQLTLNYLGYDLEWDKQYAFNNKKWQEKFYNNHWRYMLHKMMDMGILDEIINKKINDIAQDILLELKEVRNNLDEVKNGNKEVKRLVEKTMNCTKYLCDIAEDMEI